MIKDRESVEQTISKLDDIKKVSWFLFSKKPTAISLTLNLEWYKENCKNIKTARELLAKAQSYCVFLEDKLTGKELEECYNTPMELWIDAAYSRTFYNELYNYAGLFIEKLHDFIDDEEDNYAVCVYDLSDEYFTFKDEENADALINLLNGPWTLFKSTNNTLVEMRGE